MKTLVVSRFVTSPLIKMIGITFGCFTVILEIGITGYIFIAKHIHGHLPDIVLLAIGGVFGVVVVVLWVFNAPQRREVPAVLYAEPRSTSSVDKPVSQEKNVSSQMSSPESVKNQGDIVGNREDVLAEKLPEHTLDMHNAETIAIVGAGKQFQNPLVASLPVRLGSDCFIVPKEGEDPELCADKCAGPDEQHIRNGLYRYAVTDGASTSFLPAQWAHILARNFVNLERDFNGPADGLAWLKACSEQWSQWVDTIWIPQLGRDNDWSRDKAQGAQATLIGCSFSSQDLQRTGTANIAVMAVGDANFFLVHPLDEKLISYNYWSFPCTRPEEFGPVPETLATAEQLIPQTQFKRDSCVAQRGDYLFLMTDALAQWTLSKIFRQENPWQFLSNVSIQEEFRAFVLKERDKGEMESDDTTMLRVQIV